MRSTFAAAATASVASAVLDGLAPTQSQDFLEWANKFGKSYQTTRALGFRAEIFQRSCDIINELNQESQESGRPDAATFGHNFTSDMTQEEYEKLLGFVAPPGAQPSYFPPENTEERGRGLEARATAVDHAASGKMRPVKDQGECGSCWAFAANSALEGTVALQRGLQNDEVPHFSEQHLVDCTRRTKENREMFGKDYGNDGCNGGTQFDAWEFQKDHGAFLESQYPYKAKDQRCKHNDLIKAGNETYLNTKRMGTLSSIEETKRQLKDKAITIAIDASGRALEFYKSGVLTTSACKTTNLNHAVVLVGYSEKDDGGEPEPEPTPVDCDVHKWWYSCDNDAPPQKKDSNGFHNYWKIQNSWGTEWGDNGFVLFEITDGEGVCGMNSFIDYVEV